MASEYWIDFYVRYYIIALICLVHICIHSICIYFTEFKNFKYSIVNILKLMGIQDFFIIFYYKAFMSMWINFRQIFKYSSFFYRLINPKYNIILLNKIGIHAIYVCTSNVNETLSCNPIIESRKKTIEMKHASYLIQSWQISHWA